MKESIQSINAAIEKFSLQKRALESCKKALSNFYLEEVKEGDSSLYGWELEEVILCFDKCSLTIKHEFWEFPFFDTQIGLYVKDDSGVMLRDLDPIGKYHLYTDMDGNDYDDSLVIEVYKSDM